MVRRPRAFTLIELLVVISIIAILLAIMLPALGTARRAALEAKCGTNVRFLTVATLVFATEHDDWLPNHGTPGEEDAYYEVELSGATRSHQISGTETATWSDSEVLITVDLGEKV